MDNNDTQRILLLRNSQAQHRLSKYESNTTSKWATTNGKCLEKPTTYSC